jgi:hypothetical protein
VERFGKTELAVVRQQLIAAEMLLSRYYCIPDREWPAYVYDVRTLADLAPGELSNNILAHISKYEAVSEKFGRKRFDFYGICLQDHNILAACRRRTGGISLEPLMLYVLTHELVHVIRFANQPSKFFMSGTDQFAEEQRVHRITREVLRMKHDPALLPVLQAYEGYPFAAEARRMAGPVACIA